jgi:DNA primase small subunit
MTDEVQKSLAFIENQFRTYYIENQPVLPDRFGRREYAFIFFGGRGMVRHIGFDKKSKMMAFFAERAPAHAYYSSAYYQKPGAPTMDEKEWMGAELIFDLDSDHLPDAKEVSYGESLVLVKAEFVKLVHEFLLDDFGFNKKYIELYFSGGRGYHCHVKDPAIVDLDSSERREIVDYITGRDLRDAIVFREHVTDRKQYGSKSYASGKSLKMPKPDEPGWKGRISRSIIEIVNDIITSENPIEKLQGYGVKQADAERLLADLSADRIQRIKDGFLDQTRTIKRFFLNKAIRQSAVSLSAGETDEPVTCDIKRLIRLPGSLHGKTGFKVCKIELGELDGFDPLEDAVVLSDDPVEVMLSTQYSVTFKGESYVLDKGIQTVPSAVAVFLMGRRLALIH